MNYFLNAIKCQRTVSLSQVTEREIERRVCAGMSLRGPWHWHIHEIDVSYKWPINCFCAGFLESYWLTIYNGCRAPTPRYEISTTHQLYKIVTFSQEIPTHCYAVYGK